MTQQQIKAKRLEILEYTVKYYSEDTKRRAVITEPLRMCMYLTKDGRKCAVGRLLDKEKINMSIVGSVHLLFRDKPEFITEDMKLVGEEFLSELQDLHDISSYWDENGITDDGNKRVDIIKRIYIN